MKLNEQLTALVAYGTDTVNAGGSVQTVDMLTYTHDGEELLDLVHSAALACLQSGSFEQAVLAGMQWAVDAMRIYGVPDDLADLPTLTFPPGIRGARCLTLFTSYIWKMAPTRITR